MFQRPEFFREAQCWKLKMAGFFKEGFDEDPQTMTGLNSVWLSAKIHHQSKETLVNCVDQNLKLYFTLFI